jgi:hypothetical protein
MGTERMEKTRRLASRILEKIDEQLANNSGLSGSLE